MTFVTYIYDTQHYSINYFPLREIKVININVLLDYKSLTLIIAKLPSSRVGMHSDKLRVDIYNI